MSSNQSPYQPSTPSYSEATSNNKRLRFACDRCRFQKLRCPRTLQGGKSVDMFEPCSRCVNAGEQCTSSLRGKVGRPRKDASTNQSNNEGKGGSRSGDKSSSSTPTSKGKGHKKTKSDQETDNAPAVAPVFPTLPMAMTASTTPSNRSALNTPRSEPVRGVDVAPKKGTSYMADASPTVSIAESIPESRPHPWSLQNMQTPLSSEDPLVSSGPDSSISALDEPDSSAMNYYSWSNGGHSHEDMMLDQLMNDPFELHSGLDLGMDNGLNIFDGEDAVPMASNRQQGPTPMSRDDELSIALHQCKPYAAPTEIVMNGFITPQTDPGTEDFLQSLPQHQFQHQPPLQQHRQQQLQQHPRLQQTDLDQQMRPLKKMRRGGPTSAAGLRSMAAKGPSSNTACFQRLSELNIRILQYSRRPALDRQLANEMAPFCQELIDIVRQCLPSTPPSRGSQQQHHTPNLGVVDEAAPFSESESSPVPDSALVFLMLSCYTQLLQVFRLAIGRHSADTAQHHPHSSSLSPPSSTQSGIIMGDSSDGNPDAMASLLKASLTVHTVTYLLSQLHRALGQYCTEGGGDPFVNMHDQGKDGQGGDSFMTGEEDDATEENEGESQDMGVFGFGAGGHIGVSLPLRWNRGKVNGPVSGNAAALGKIACLELTEHERDLRRSASLLDLSSRNSTL